MGKKVLIDIKKSKNTPFKDIQEIITLLETHTRYRENCLNLIASENMISPLVRSLLDNELVARYGCYSTRNMEDREYTGNKYIHQLELKTHELIKESFGAKYVDLRSLSGHLAGIAVILGILKPNESLIEMHLKDWGHGMAGPLCEISHLKRSIKVEYFQLDEDRAVDMQALRSQIEKIHPRLVILGGSGTLFADNINIIKETCVRLKTIIAYDVSHITGLIVGKTFPNPLDHGADLIFGSTHKSFPGPQGGFILSNDKNLIIQIGETLSPGLVTSHHIYRLPAFAASLLEMKFYGKEYGTQTILNSKALAKALDERGFTVLGKKRGYSDTHLILVSVDKNKGIKPAKLLEQANILCSDDFSGQSSEIRIGTPEITRQGMKEPEMSIIADFFKRILLDNEEPSLVRKDVQKFNHHFLNCEYSLGKY